MKNTSMNHGIAEVLSLNLSVAYVGRGAGSIRSEEKHFVSPEGYLGEPIEEDSRPPTIEPPAVIFQVELPGGRRRVYPSKVELQEAILNGSVRRSFRARKVSGSVLEGGSDLSAWNTVEALALADPQLERLYRPVWASAKRLALFGAVAGCLLKGLDTTYMLFSVDERLGLLWLFSVGALAISRWYPLAPAAALFFSLKIGPGVNLFVPALGVAAVGSILGVPFGIIVGTLAGYFRRQKAVVAPDAYPERALPFLLGVVLPLVFLTAVAFLYFRDSPCMVVWLPH